MLIVLDKSTHEDHLYQPRQTNSSELKIAVTFLSAYNGVFNVTNTNKKIFFKKTITDDDGFLQISVPLGVYEIKSLNDEIKRVIIDEEHYTEAN